MTAVLKAALCDDEPLALDRLSELLSQCENVEVVGAFPSGHAVIETMASTRPDLLLLDIEMPRMDGFDVIEALSRLSWSVDHPPPLIVFATARPEFAASAFDCGALDFICKPVRLGRLEQTLDRARLALAHREAQARLLELSEQLEHLKGAHADADRHKIWVRNGDDTIQLDANDIDWVAAEGEYVRLHVGRASYLERGALQDAAIALEPYGFMRVHRSAIVNIRKIASVRKGAWGRLSLELRSGDEVAVGKKYRHDVAELTRKGLISMAEASREA